MGACLPSAFPDERQRLSGGHCGRLFFFGIDQQSAAILLRLACRRHMLPLPVTRRLPRRSRCAARNLKSARGQIVLGSCEWLVSLARCGRGMLPLTPCDDDKVREAGRIFADIRAGSAEGNLWAMRGS